MIDSNSLFHIWLGFTILSIIVIVPFVIWAIRSGQFSKFDYASRLPLTSMIVEEQPSDCKIRENINNGKKENVST